MSNEASSGHPQALLAVDLGLRTGLALYQSNGRLVWYRSHNFGTSSRLRKGVPALLAESPGLAVLVIEGGGNLAEIWLRAAERRQLRTFQIGAESWRERLLYQREQRSGEQAKHYADPVARRVIAWSGAARPTALRHDAAEAILIGLWGVLEMGWLDCIPAEIRRG